MAFSYTAMILAAGYGKRMMPLTKYNPKPLLEIRGKTLLENNINFLKKLGCKKIIINSHYLHHKVELFLKKINQKNDISLVYEKEILDTGGGIKNITQFLDQKNLLIINSDIFWRENNLEDVQILINNYNIYKNSVLLLVNQENAYGLEKSKGDFILKNGKAIRYNNDKEILFYTGLQILNINSIKNFSENKFSINLIWDILIDQGKLYGEIMQSDWYHVGDLNGLNIARNLPT